MDDDIDEKSDIFQADGVVAEMVIEVEDSPKSSEKEQKCFSPTKVDQYIKQIAENTFSFDNTKNSSIFEIDLKGSNINVPPFEDSKSVELVDLNCSTYSNAMDKENCVITSRFSGRKRVANRKYLEGNPVSTKIAKVEKEEPKDETKEVPKRGRGRPKGILYTAGRLKKKIYTVGRPKKSLHTVGHPKKILRAVGRPKKVHPVGYPKKILHPVGHPKKILHAVGSKIKLNTVDRTIKIHDGATENKRKEEQASVIKGNASKNPVGRPKKILHAVVRSETPDGTTENKGKEEQASIRKGNASKNSVGRPKKILHAVVRPEKIPDSTAENKRKEEQASIVKGNVSKNPVGRPKKILHTVACPEKIPDSTTENQIKEEQASIEKGNVSKKILNPVGRRAVGRPKKVLDGTTENKRQEDQASIKKAIAKKRLREAVENEETRMKKRTLRKLPFRKNKDAPDIPDFKPKVFWWNGDGEGSGMKLRDIDGIYNGITRQGKKSLRSLYKVIFFACAKEKEDVAEKILNFNGFPFDKSSFEYVKRHKLLRGLVTTTIENMCETLMLPTGSKNTMIANILNFLLKPKGSSDPSKDPSMQPVVLLEKLVLDKKFFKAAMRKSLQE